MQQLVYLLPMASLTPGCAGLPTTTSPNTSPVVSPRGVTSSTSNARLSSSPTPIASKPISSASLSTSPSSTSPPSSSPPSSTLLSSSPPTSATAPTSGWGMCGNAYAAAAAANQLSLLQMQLQLQMQMEHSETNAACLLPMLPKSAGGLSLPLSAVPISIPMALSGSNSTTASLIPGFLPSTATPIAFPTAMSTPRVLNEKQQLQQLQQQLQLQAQQKQHLQQRHVQLQQQLELASGRPKSPTSDSTKNSGGATATSAKPATAVAEGAAVKSEFVVRPMPFGLPMYSQGSSHLTAALFPSVTTAPYFAMQTAPQQHPQQQQQGQVQSNKATQPEADAEKAAYERKVEKYRSKRRTPRQPNQKLSATASKRKRDSHGKFLPAAGQMTSLLGELAAAAVAVSQSSQNPGSSNRPTPQRNGDGAHVSGSKEDQSKRKRLEPGNNEGEGSATPMVLESRLESSDTKSAEQV